jgi:hypothetical protein
MRAMDDAVQKGIGDGWIEDRVKPVFGGELAGDNGGRDRLAIFDNFQEVSSFCVVERGKA